MPTETQYTISEWSRKTFGCSRTNVEVAARAALEVAELVEAHLLGDEQAILKEAADVAIVMSTLATRMGVDLPTTSTPASAPKGDDVSAVATHMARIVSGLSRDDNNPNLAIETHNLYMRLRWICMAHDSDLRSEVDAKMAVNRARTWGGSDPVTGVRVKVAPLVGGSRIAA